MDIESHIWKKVLIICFKTVQKNYYMVWAKCNTGDVPVAVFFVCVRIYIKKFVYPEVEMGYKG